MNAGWLAGVIDVWVEESEADIPLGGRFNVMMDKTLVKGSTSGH